MSGKPPPLVFTEQMFPEFRKLQRINMTTTYKLTIPKLFVKKLGLKHRDWMKLTLEGRKIVVEKAEGAKNSRVRF